MTELRTATIGNIIVNIFLFAIKLAAGIMSNSLSVISSAMDSFMDIVYSTAVYVTVKISRTKADLDHPFGHHRAEPIAALIVAIFSGILSFQILKSAIVRMINSEPIEIGAYIFLVLGITIVLKLAMSFYFRRMAAKQKSPALKATSIDCRNDVLSNSVALAGIIASYYGFSYFDNIAAIVIALFIMRSGYKIGIENIDYLMGKAPPKEAINKIRKKVLAIKEVKGIELIRAHYLGDKIQIEVHINLSRNLNIKKAHDVGEKVRNEVEKIEGISNAFVHINAV